ncbi:YXWGXW repeat-containing protein [Stieleria mannarensis]|uniref:YXWGXW repeat-containing protein n=1 Tax=Stieleria mannarensis TaxID=2755585 RepID=UPI0016016E8E|nr:YXWGXW repeat-containing protein [Rhodopirellula sp. JC639]
MTCLPRRLIRSSVLAATVVLVSSPLFAQALQNERSVLPPPVVPPPIDETSNADLPQDHTSEEESDVEFMAAGPLHESYAEPYTADPQPAPTVPREPPPLVKELPPTLRPDSEKSTWVSGYWDWDPQRNDFVWVSGVWREVPPDRRWVPGYWEAEGDGYRRVVGFWAHDESATVDYLPPPPESLDQGPVSPAPSDDHFYVPGNWTYQSNEYQWTPGFWARCQPDWVWVPNQYVWTPRGCVFRSGYWDYRFHRRGVLFTPVYYRSPIYLRPGYWYRPRYVVNTGINLLANLFINPLHRNYYFGNYYGAGYGSQFYPWINYYRGPRRYDPLYSYYGIRSLHDRGPSLDHIARQHQQFKRHEELRPPRRYDERRGSGNGKGKGNVNEAIGDRAALASRIEDFARQNPDDIRFRRLSETQAESIGRSAGQSFDRMQKARKDFERLSPGKQTLEAAVAGRSDRSSNRGRISSFRLPTDAPTLRGLPRGLGNEGQQPSGRTGIPFDRGLKAYDRGGRVERDRIQTPGQSPGQTFDPVRQFGSPRGNKSNPSSGIDRSAFRDLPTIRSTPSLRSSSTNRLSPGRVSPGRVSPSRVSPSLSQPPGRSSSPRQFSPPSIDRGSRRDFGGLKARGGGFDGPSSFGSRGGNRGGGKGGPGSGRAKGRGK